MKKAAFLIALLAVLLFAGKEPLTIPWQKMTAENTGLTN